MPKIKHSWVWVVPIWARASAADKEDSDQIARMRRVIGVRWAHVSEDMFSQIAARMNLRIRAVWPDWMFGTPQTDKDQRFIHADSECSNQTT